MNNTVFCCNLRSASRENGQLANREPSLIREYPVLLNNGVTDSGNLGVRKNSALYCYPERMFQDLNFSQ